MTSLQHVSTNSIHHHGGSSSNVGGAPTNATGSINLNAVSWLLRKYLCLKKMNETF